MSNGENLGRAAIAQLARGGAVLAPMSGVTDIGFRRLAHRFGASLVVSEMVASRALVNRSAEASLRAEGAGLTPHVVQLAGREPYWMGEAARVAEASGAAVVDINMGCPARSVTGGQCGSALMRDLDHAMTIVEAVVAAVTIPVTLKMRLGWDHANLNAPELARRAEQAGVALVTVHGRTRQQFYKGAADWAAIRAVCESVAIPVVANGDIDSPISAGLCLAQSGAHAVMVGRAALGRPWLVGSIARSLSWESAHAEPTDALKTDCMIEHYETILMLYGRKIGVRHARKHLVAYAEAAMAEGSAAAAAARPRLATEDEPAAVIGLLASLYGTGASVSEPPGAGCLGVAA